MFRQVEIAADQVLLDAPVGADVGVADDLGDPFGYLVGVRKLGVPVLTAADVDRVGHGLGRQQRLLAGVVPVGGLVLAAGRDLLPRLLLLGHRVERVLRKCVELLVQVDAHLVLLGHLRRLAGLALARQGPVPALVPVAVVPSVHGHCPGLELRGVERERLAEAPTELPSDRVVAIHGNRHGVRVTVVVRVEVDRECVAVAVGVGRVGGGRRRGGDEHPSDGEHRRGDAGQSPLHCGVVPSVVTGHGRAPVDVRNGESWCSTPVS